MNIAVFDLETKNRPGKQADVDAGRADCLWEEKGKLGISVGVAFSYATGDFSVHLDDNIADLWDMLAKADMVTGFNILSFDIPLLYAEMVNVISGFGGMSQGTRSPSPDNVILKALNEQHAAILAKTFDLYPVVKEGAGADTYDKGYRVDDLLRATWGHEAAKTGNGAFAPDLFKAGRMGELISYCVADVQRERRLFERCFSVGTMRAAGYKGGAEEFPVKRPQDILFGPGYIGQLPFPLDGAPEPTPPPSKPYAAPAPKAAPASEEI